MALCCYKSRSSPPGNLPSRILSKLLQVSEFLDFIISRRRHSENIRRASSWNVPDYICKKKVFKCYQKCPKFIFGNWNWWIFREVIGISALFDFPGIHHITDTHILIIR